MPAAATVQSRPSRRARRAARRSWYLVVPAALFGWNVAILIGYVVYLILVESCPIDRSAEGRCIAAWFGPAELTVRVGAAAVGALLAIVLPLFAQPARPVIVSWVVFTVGTLIAGIVAWLADSIALFGVAAVSGLATVVLVTLYFRRRDQNSEPAD